MPKILIVIGFALCFTQCVTKATVQTEPVDYVRDRHMFELTDIVCDSVIYKYTFIGCMESNKDGWGQDESACKAYAKQQACKPKQR